MKKTMKISIIILIIFVILIVVGKNILFPPYRCYHKKSRYGYYERKSAVARNK